MLANPIWQFEIYPTERDRIDPKEIIRRDQPFENDWVRIMFLSPK